MNQYMMTMTLLEEPEFSALVPQQRTCLDALLETGMMRSYALSRDRSKLWGIVRGKSEEEVRRILEEFSLTGLVQIEIVTLGFSNIEISPLLTVSMN